MSTALLTQISTVGDSKSKVLENVILSSTAVLLCARISKWLKGGRVVSENGETRLSPRHWLSYSLLGCVIAWLEGKETESGWEVRENAWCFWKLSISWPLGRTASFQRNEGCQNEYNLSKIKSERLEFTNLEQTESEAAGHPQTD